MGRPSKLTPALQERFVDHVRQGHYIETVCGVVGIHKSSYYLWMEKGEAGEQPYSDFYDAIKSAESAAEAEALEGILTHGAETWQALAWFLERRHPKRWRRSDKIEQEVTVRRGGPEPDDLDAEISRLLSGHGLGTLESSTTQVEAPSPT